MHTSIKIITCLFLAVCLSFSSALAQEEEPQTNHYYVADYDLEWTSLMEWNENYREHSVPILRELEEEGIITGWSAWMHNTGGDYNWRLVIGSSDWDHFDEFWSEYLSRLPDGVSESFGGAINAHSDQIWDATIRKFAENSGDTRYIYETLYRIAFSDGGEWNRQMRDKEVPVWEETMEQGLISGYVVLGHNTGDRYNHARIFLFTDWDSMDDFHAYYLDKIFSDAETWDRMGSMIMHHTDVIWESVSSTTEGEEE